MKLLLLSLILFLYTGSGYLYLKKSFPKQKLGDSPSSPTGLIVNSSANFVNISGWSSPIYSGYLNVNKTQSNSSLYYLLYTCPKSNISDIGNFTSYPLVIWLNGGPGSSSLLGAFFENGPFGLQWDNSSGKYSEVQRSVAWTENYHVMYVDQPIGTGASYLENSSELTVNQSQIAQHFYNALQEFYQLPNFTNFQNIPLILAGESYAGKYVPCIAQKILQENKNQGNFQIPLKGISIGDGFTDPLTIMAEVGMFAYNLGLIDYNERMIIEQDILRGLLFAKAGDWGAVNATFNDYVFGNLQTFTANVDVYNIQKFVDDTSSLDTFLLDSATSKKYNILVTYEQGSDQVYNALEYDFMKPYNDVVEDLLNNYQIPILIYNGQDDLIVTSPGTISWVENLQWYNSSAFNSMDFELWEDSNQNVLGYKKRANYLELRTVNQAGHLVPRDQPDSALDMITDFINRAINPNK